MSRKCMNPNNFSEKADNKISRKMYLGQDALEEHSFSSNVKLSTCYCLFGSNEKNDFLNVTRISYVHSS